METRVSVHNYDCRNADNVHRNNCINNDSDDDDDDDGDNIRSADAYIDNSMIDAKNGGEHDSSAAIAEIDRISDVDRVSEESLDHDEGSNTVDCLDEPDKNCIHIPNYGVDDDRSSLESSGSLRNSCNALSTQDVLPIESARARFLQIVVDNFISEHLIEKRGAYIDGVAEHGEDNLNKRKSGEVQYEGDPMFVLPLMYVANLYETLVNEVNFRLSPLSGLRDKNIGVALEAAGGLYRKLTQKFPKTGPYSFKRRELATSLETRRRFPELVVQEEKRVRFVVANGLNIVEKPSDIPFDDAEWFKRLTGRTEAAITARDYKFYNPRHKVRRTSNSSPTIPGLLSYHGSSDHEFQTESTGDQETQSKQPLVTVARQPLYQPAVLNHQQSLHQNQQPTFIACSHESGQSSHLHDIALAHECSTLSQSLASVEPLGGNHLVARLNMMPSSPAKFCDECGSPYVRPTSKFCSQCGTKRFGI